MWPRRKRATARVAALPARRGARRRSSRLAPSGRSLAVGLALALLAAAAYAAARETSLFAVRQLEIVGGTPRMKAEVRAALAPELGESLLKVNGAEIDGRVAAFPTCARSRFDRAFPHTLASSSGRSGRCCCCAAANDAWVVSARGRVLRTVHNPELSSLPRIWVPRATRRSRSARSLAPGRGGVAAAALAPLPRRAPLGGSASSARTRRELTLRAPLGPRAPARRHRDDLRLKLAIARRILAMLGTSATERLPRRERPRAARRRQLVNSQVGGRG